jgi:3-methylcrotonyl-CoA carboxylase alpha subunit
VSELERPIGPGEAARRLGVSTRTVQRWLRDGNLPAVRVGSRLKVHPSAFSGAAAALPVPPEAVAVPASVQAPAWIAPAPAEAVPATLPGGMPIRRLLIANRGELVVRIARTCLGQGVTPVALVAPDQGDAWWANQVADRVPLAGSYLDADSVLAAARMAHVDAVHPGYGFLAENADFADAVEAAGLRWVGPPGSAMRALGDKAAARRLALSVDVPIVPGYDGEDQGDEALLWNAAHIGYPVLIKPSGGGGGKGMHVAREERELAELLPRARREALAAFGDARLVLERLVEKARHVEVQVLADRHDHAVHLGERDCSLQRRHQKVMEETPSPGVSAELRERLGGAALRLVAAAGYVGAGTAEFLVGPGGEFFFLELNARLQVEHTVTEAVTGRDLVADQLRIAAGERLGFSQADVAPAGHAIEARVYAEDPWNGFLPSVGRVAEARWPAGPGIRVDAGTGSGDLIGTRYDPLLGKIVSMGNDRADALDRLADALHATAVLGVTTNLGFLRGLLALPAVQRGEATTELLERELPRLEAPSMERAWPVAAAAITTLARTWGQSSVPASVTSVAAGFRLNAPAVVRVVIGEEERGVRVTPGAEADLHWTADPGAGELPAVVIDLDGLAVHARLAAGSGDDASPRTTAGRPAGARVSAPMPGTLLEVRVQEGDRVEAGQVLAVLEAMKMEHTVPAPTAGTVARLAVARGDQVQRGDVLIELA